MIIKLLNLALDLHKANLRDTRQQRQLDLKERQIALEERDIEEFKEWKPRP